jgi:hypothetical protein
MLKTNVKKQPILKQPIIKQPIIKQTFIKQPIIKSGQTQKDREEVTLSNQFIGPKLPGSNSKTTPEIPIDTTENTSSISDSKEQGKSYKSINSNNIVSPTQSTESDQWSQHNGIAEVTTESSLQTSVLSDNPAGPKINYTKDELAKYGDLSIMSKVYAKISQVSVVNFAPNGSTEINMVELDKTNQLQVQSENSNNVLIQQQELLMIQDKHNNDKILEAYHQEQQNNAIKYHLQQQQQQQQRSIQIQLQNIQQLRANQQIQQMNELHNMQIIQAQQALQAQQQQQKKQQMIAMQLEQLDILNQQKQQQRIQIQRISPQQLQHFQQVAPQSETPVAIEFSELSNLIAPKDVTINADAPLVNTTTVTTLNDSVSPLQNQQTSTSPIVAPETNVNDSIVSSQISNEVQSNMVDQVESINNHQSVQIQIPNESLIGEVQKTNNNDQNSQYQSNDLSPREKELNKSPNPTVNDIQQNVIVNSPELLQQQQQQQQLQVQQLQRSDFCNPLPTYDLQGHQQQQPLPNKSPILTSPGIPQNVLQLQQQSQPQHQQYQPIQLIQHQNNLVHSNHGLIGLQPQHQHPQQQHVQLIHPQQHHYEAQNQHLTVLNANQIAALQQNQALQQQLQAQAVHHQQLQQQQAQAIHTNGLGGLQYQLQHHPGIGVGLPQSVNLQPQFIQVRPHVGLAPQHQPQFVPNNNQSFFRIFPQ